MFAVDPAGIRDAAGHAVAGGDSTAWEVDIATPVIVSLEAPATNPRNTVVTSLDVTSPRQSIRPCSRPTK